jgi:hypothetical protein
MAPIEVTEESLRAGLDDVLAGLAAEAADCDPDDGWYPDTGELEDLLDEVEDLAGEAPDAARELAGHAAARIREVLAAGNSLTGDLAGALARAEELQADALHRTASARPGHPRPSAGRGASPAARYASSISRMVTAALAADVGTASPEVIAAANARSWYT